MPARHTPTPCAAALLGAVAPQPRDALGGSPLMRSAAAGLLTAALAALLYLGSGLSSAWAQAPAAAPQPVASGFGSASSGPSWKELTSAQRTALAPLSGTWGQLTESHKRKWIALAANYAKLPPAEQAKLHSRMSEWAALSPQQRTQARLNFGEAQQVSPDEKRAKWEAYQALPPEDRRKLREGASARRPATAAAAVKPVPPQKLASVPKSASDEPKPARIVAPPAAEPASSGH